MMSVHRVEVSRYRHREVGTLLLLPSLSDRLSILGLGLMLVLIGELELSFHKLLLELLLLQAELKLLLLFSLLSFGRLA
jgi:hypothetical protein